MQHPVTLILGDGTGPELARAAREVLDATGVALEWHEVEAGLGVQEREGQAFPTRVLDSIRRTRTCLKAPIAARPGATFRATRSALLDEFDLHASRWRFKSYPGARTPFRGVDLTLFCGSQEDLREALEFERGDERTHELAATIERLLGRRLRGDAAIGIRPLSTFGADRIVQAAYEYARSKQRRTLTVGHRADLLRHTDGLFLHTARNVAVRYPDVPFGQRTVDALARELLQHPEDFDVLVLPSAWADALTGLCAGLVGGLGLVPGVHRGDGEVAVFETLHGCAPKHAGLDRVNPCALILAGALMLEHLGEARAAERLERAVASVIREGRRVTYDLKPDRDDPAAVGTREMARAIQRALVEPSP